MQKSAKFLLKVFLIILGTLLLIFLLQFGKNLYDIKTGKMKFENYENSFTKSETFEEVEYIDYKKLVLGDFPSYGADNPEITIVEFGNFACPFSKQASHSARNSMLKYKDKIKFIYRDFPLDDLYPNSSSLSLAGKCANAQNKFWQFHDKAYGAENINAYAIAVQSGMNENLFLGCIKQEKYLTSLEKDLEDGILSGVRGTPTFFFIKKGFEDDVIKVEGAIPNDIFEGIINNLLKEF